MAEGVRCALLRLLENLTPEELKKFKLYLQDQPAGREIPRGRLEGADRAEVTALLVQHHGEQEAWELALSLLKKMGMMELWERARAEGPQGTAEGLSLKTIQDRKNEYQEQMRKRFQNIRDRNSRPGEWEPFQHRFTQLLFLQNYRHKKEKKHELLVLGREHAKFMKSRGQFTTLSALFDPDPRTGDPPRTVVLKGAAGIGKTTVARKVMLDWAERNCYQKQFDWIFYLSCRELNPLGERETSFIDLIANDWPGPQATMAEIMSQPERILFIIDGLDELKFPCNEHRHDLCKDWKQRRPLPILLSSLLKETLLPKASLLLTTRLTALKKFGPLLENARHVGILGFSEEQRKEFFCKFFRNKKIGKKMFNLVQDNNTLFTLCSVPLMSWIVCTCLKQQMESGEDPVQGSKTTTALYMYYLSNLMPLEDKIFVSQHLRALCCLAAEGIWEKKLLFDEDDLRRHGLQEVDVSAFLDMNVFQKDTDCEKCYSFIHLSFQEFFAAMFYGMPSNKEEMDVPDSSIPVKKLLRQESEDSGSFVVLVVRFLFGFLNADVAREMERKFQCRMSTEIKSQLLHWIKGKIISDYGSYLQIDFDLPECYSYLYETQDAEFITQVLHDIEVINIWVERNLDAFIAVFFIKCCTKARKISFCSFVHLPARVWKALFFSIRKNQSLKEIIFEGNHSDDPCMEFHYTEQKRQLHNLETLSCKSLKRKRMDSDCLEDGGPNLPCETFGKKNSQVGILTITDIHCPYFVAFSSNFLIDENLKDLKLANTCLGEVEINRLCKALEKQGCELQTLSLRSCKSTPQHYQKLFSALHRNESLKTLDLSENSFNEGEIKVLCKALENPKLKLKTLSLRKCKVNHLDYYQNLFSVLHCYESLKTLDLIGNSFEEGEIKVLCTNLENSNCKLEELSLACCFFSSQSYQNLFSSLRINKSLKFLDLRKNYIEEGEIKILCNFLENTNHNLKTLRLTICKLPIITLQYLLSIFLKNENLKVLELALSEVGGDFQNWKPETFECWGLRNEIMKTLSLCHISFKEGEIEVLCKVLENPTCNLEKLRLVCCNITPLGHQHLFSALHNYKSLKSLELCKNSYDEEALKVLLKALENPNCKLEELSLDHCKFPAIALQYFLSIVLKNENLKALNVSFCDFQRDTMMDFPTSFGMHFKDMKQRNESMNSLDFSEIFFEEGDIKVLHEVLGNPKCKIGKLSLEYCKFSSLGCYNLFSVLHNSESLKSLELILISFEEEEIKALCKALENPDCKLEELSLEDCKFPVSGEHNLVSVLHHYKSLKSLHLSHISFEDEEMKGLCKALENPNCKLEELRLENCKFPVSGEHNLVSVLHHYKSLKSLHLSHISFEDEEMKGLCKALENPNCKLEELRLYNCKFPVIVLQYFLFILLKNEILKDLKISFWDTMMDFSTYICMQFKNMKQRNESMKSLEFREISFEEEDIKVLHEVLGNSKCMIGNLSLWHCKLPILAYQNLISVLHHYKSLKSLYLSDISFDEEEIKALSKALENPNCKLEELSLSKFKVTCPLDYQPLFSALCINKSLETLHVKYKSFEEEEIKVLGTALEHPNCKLEKLSLCSCEVTASLGFQPLFLAIHNNKSLKSLTLDSNSFKEEEIKVLGTALEHPNCKVENLSLCSCKVTTPLGYQPLFSALHSNKSLETLALDDNSFEVKEIKFLCTALENSNCKLVELRLKSCKLPDISCQFFLSTLLKNESLKVLDLSSSSFGCGTLKVISEALRSENPKLQRLRF